MNPFLFWSQLPLFIQICESTSDKPVLTADVNFLVHRRLLGSLFHASWFILRTSNFCWYECDSSYFWLLVPLIHSQRYKWLWERYSHRSKLILWPSRHSKAFYLLLAFTSLLSGSGWSSPRSQYLQVWKRLRICRGIITCCFFLCSKNQFISYDDIQANKSTLANVPPICSFRLTYLAIACTPHRLRSISKTQQSMRLCNQLCFLSVFCFCVTV